MHVMEIINRDEPVELTDQQKAALDKELSAVAADPDYLLKWNDIKHRFKPTASGSGPTDAINAN
jgi:hypothetical protein